MCVCVLKREHDITKTHTHLTSFCFSRSRLWSSRDWFTVILKVRENWPSQSRPTRIAYKSEALLSNNPANRYAEKNPVVTLSPPERQKNTTPKQNSSSQRAASYTRLQPRDGRYFASSHRCFQLIPNSQSLPCLSSRLQPAPSKYIFSVSAAAEPPSSGSTRWGWQMCFLTLTQRCQCWDRALFVTVNSI